MPDQDFSVTLSADVSDLTSAFEEAKSSGEETAEGLKGAFEGAGEGMSAIGEKANEAGEQISKLSEGLSGLAEIAGLGAIARGPHKIEETVIEASTSRAQFAARSQRSLAKGYESAASSEADR